VLLSDLERQRYVAEWQRMRVENAALHPHDIGTRVRADHALRRHRRRARVRKLGSSPCGGTTLRG
jgi:hypothetical protein